MKIHVLSHFAPRMRLHLWLLSLVCTLSFCLTSQGADNEDNESKEKMITRMEGLLDKWNPTQIETTQNFRLSEASGIAKISGDSLLLIDERGDPSTKSAGYVYAKNPAYQFSLSRMKVDSPWALTSVQENPNQDHQKDQDLGDIKQFRKNVGVLPVSVGGYFNALMYLREDFIDVSLATDPPSPLAGGISPLEVYLLTPDKVAWRDQIQRGESSTLPLFDKAYIGFQRDGIPVFLQTHSSGKRGTVINTHSVTAIENLNGILVPAKVSSIIDQSNSAEDDIIKLSHRVTFNDKHDPDIFKLSEYGLPEPSFGNQKETNYVFWVAGSLALVFGLIGVAFRSRSRK